MADTSRQRILVLGMGVSGCAAAELAAHDGADVIVLDAKDDDQLRDRADGYRRRGMTVCLDWHDDRWPEAVDLAVISPGIAPGSRLGRLAQDLECPVISELEYGFRHAACPVLAITGTNGKSTTTELVTHCLRSSGREVISAGNIGVPLCEVVRRHSDADFLVVEVSSFQLERVAQFSPLVGALLNLTPDHLDRHPSFDDYLSTKLRLFANMKRCEQAVLRLDLLEMPAVRDGLPSAGGQPITFTSEDDYRATFYLDEAGNLCQRREGEGVPLLHRDELRLRGRHNIENVLAMLAIGHAAGIDPATLVAAAKTFAPSPHRLELVAVHGGVTFINDSKATNPDAMARAIEALTDEARGDILLVAGGLDKELDFEAVKPLLKRCVREVFLIGKSQKKLAKTWRDVVCCKTFASMAAAVEAAIEAGRTGDMILLSPGCASQDMFLNYAERGNVFCELIKRSAGE